MKMQCPACSAIFEAPDYYVGRECRCVECQQIFNALPYMPSTKKEISGVADSTIDVFATDENKDGGIAIIKPKTPAELMSDAKKYASSICIACLIMGIISFLTSVVACVSSAPEDLKGIGFIIGVLIGCFFLVFWLVPVAVLKLLMVIASK